MNHHRGRINERFCYCENFASISSFVIWPRQKMFQVVQPCDLHKLCWENAYLRSFLRCNGTVAQQLFGTLGHWDILIFEKTFVFLFIESVIKSTPLLCANFQMPWSIKCNGSNWRWPECFYEPGSPVTTPKSGQLKLPVVSIQQSYGWMYIHAGSDKSAAHGRTWLFQKAYRRLQNYE